MKIRMGFVSNSSSSSFLLVVKGDLEQELKKAFEIKGEHPLKGIGDTVVELILNKSEEFASVEEYEDEWGKGELSDEMREYVEQGYKLYSGSFDNDGDSVEQFLCENDLHYTSENLIIEHNGGY